MHARHFQHADIQEQEDNHWASPQTLGDIIAQMWAARLHVLIGVLIFAAAALFFWSQATGFYKHQIVLAPANPINGAEVSSLLADENLFALKYLVQRVGVGGSSDFTRFENTYAGPSVAALLLQDATVKQGLARDYAFGFMRDNHAMTPARLSEYLARRVKLQPIGATPLRRLVYHHPDPAFGTYLLTRIHTLTDTLIRQTIRAEAIERVQYLQDAVSETPNPEHRRALTTLLLEQERLRMLVSIDQPYAASVIEPASASAKPVWPDLALLLTVAILCGGFLGLVAHGLRRRAD
jgi:hypothetical protein